jgi:hypothetical protein
MRVRVEGQAKHLEIEGDHFGIYHDKRMSCPGSTTTMNAVRERG